MHPLEISEADYVRQILTAYRQTPTTAGRVYNQDRLLAAALYRRGIPLDVVENALVLGAMRRLYRDPGEPPLQPVRSLHYFNGIIQEVLDIKAHPKTRSAYPRYFQYLRYKVQNFEHFKQRFRDYDKFHQS